jgi:hypothetical protein
MEVCTKRFYGEFGLMFPHLARESGKVRAFAPRMESKFG